MKIRKCLSTILLFSLLTSMYCTTLPDPVGKSKVASNTKTSAKDKTKSKSKPESMTAEQELEDFMKFAAAKTQRNLRSKALNIIKQQDVITKNEKAPKRPKKIPELSVSSFDRKINKHLLPKGYWTSSEIKEEEKKHADENYEHFRKVIDESKQRLKKLDFNKQ